MEEEGEKEVSDVRKADVPQSGPDSSELDSSAKEVRKFSTTAELEEYLRGRCWYFNKEIDWLKSIVKGNGLHHGTGKQRGQEGGNPRGREYMKGSQTSQDSRQRGQQRGSGGYQSVGRDVRNVQSHSTGAAPATSE